MPTSVKRDHHFKGVLAIFLAGICFGTTGTSQTLLGKEISPLAIGSARLIVGALALQLFARFFSSRSKAHIDRKDLWLSALGVAIYQLAFFSAVKSTGVSTATITALGSSPIFTGIIAFFLIKEKPIRAWFVATALTIIGILLLNNGGTDTRFNLGGFILALTAAAGVALMNVSARRALSAGTELPIFMAKVFTRSALLISPFLFTEHIRWLATAKGLTLVIWLGVIATALAYSLYATGLKHLAASTAATLLLAEPATATLLAVTILGNTVAPAGWVGIGFVLAGLIYLGARS